MDDNPEISGILHKRRGGFAKLMSAWQTRFFIVSKSGVLTYFDTEHDENILDMKPRGRLDLSLVHYDFFKAEQISESSPTPFIMTITPAHEEKWKLCAVTKDQQDQWSAIFERYAKKEKAQTSPGHAQTRQSILYPNGAAVSYHSDTEENKPVKQKFSPLPSKTSNPDLVAVNNAATTPAPTVSPTPVVSPTQPITQKAASTKTGVTKVKKGLKVSKGNSLFDPDWIEWMMVVIIMNFCFYKAYATQSSVAFTFYFTFANVIVAQTLNQRSHRAVKANLAGKKEAEAAAKEREKELAAASAAASISTETSLAVATGTTTPEGNDPHGAVLEALGVESKAAHGADYRPLAGL